MMMQSERVTVIALAISAFVIGAVAVVVLVARGQPWAMNMTEPPADAVPSTADPGANSTPTPDPFEDLTIAEFEASQLLPTCMGSEVAIEKLVIRKMKADAFFDLSYAAANVPNEDVWVMAFVTRSPLAGRLDLASSIDASGVPAGYPAPGATHANAATIRALTQGPTPTSRFTDSSSRTTAYCVFWVDSDEILATGQLHPTQEFWTIMDLEALPRQ
jgi:hypothetical protein